MPDILRFLTGLYWHGQVLMYLILLCSVAALAIVVERLIHFSRSGLRRAEFMEKVVGLVQRGKMVEAISACDRLVGKPLARVIRAGILNHDRDRSEVLDAANQVRLEAVAELKRYLPLLATLGYVAPLLGFLGSVAGLIEVFRSIQTQSMLISPADLALGVREALFSTAAGLAVAIPVLVFHNYFASRVEHLADEMQWCSTELARELARRVTQ